MTYRGHVILKNRKRQKTTISAHCAKNKHTQCFNEQCPCSCGHGIGAKATYGNNQNNSASGTKV